MKAQNTSFPGLEQKPLGQIVACPLFHPQRLAKNLLSLIIGNNKLQKGGYHEKAYNISSYGSAGRKS